MVHDAYTLWGRSISAGDSLSGQERVELERIKQQSPHDLVRQVIGKILTAEPRQTTDLQSLDSEPDPVCLADEITVRAREAFIATGEMPGMAEMIRAGRADHLVGIRTAIQVMRDRELNVAGLMERLPAPKQTIMPPMVPREPTWLDSLAAWFDRAQHRWARLITRYDGSRNRTLRLAQQIVALQRQAAEDREALHRELSRVEDRSRVADKRHETALGRKDQEINRLIREAKQASDMLATRHLNSRAHRPESQIEQVYSRLSPSERQAVEELIRRAALYSSRDASGKKTFAIKVNDDAPYGASGVADPRSRGSGRVYY